VKPLAHRERVLLALDHREPDRVSIDFGGLSTTGIFAGAYEPLKALLGLALDQPIRLAYPRCEIVRVDTALVDRFGGDVLPIQAEGTNVLHYSNSTPPVVSGGFYLMATGCETDEYGLGYARPEGSPYAVVSRSPFAGRPDVAEIARYEWPDPTDPRRIRGLKETAQRLRRTDDRALAIGLPGRFLSFGQDLCGYTEWMIYLITERKFVEALLDKALEIQLGVCESVLVELGDDVDILVFADDFGTQQDLQISPKMYRDLFKPRQKSLFERVKKLTQARIMMHSDGAIASILPDLIEVGVEIINPVQPTCAGMDTAVLKRQFGQELSFWGSIDTQHVLPFGTPQEVRDEVKRRIDHLAPGGGFVLAPVHNIQPEVPPRNVVAMFEAALECGFYS
jgi:uroporphyrinogen decarboxylase